MKTKKCISYQTQVYADNAYSLVKNGITVVGSDGVFYTEPKAREFFRKLSKRGIKFWDYRDSMEFDIPIYE